ncbi:protein [Escherichia coli]|uniref:Protein n=1 Tax=Escherichia coli TaxID=562 RepID=A0A376MXB4_ECOLX|nr:protein [Escherichia coli]
MIFSLTLAAGSGATGGKGSFTPMNATWDVAGKGEWHDSTITLTDLSTGFDQLQYGTMTVEKAATNSRQARRLGT